MMNGIYGIEFISPLQGSNSWRQIRWTMSIAEIYSSFSAINSKYNFVLQGYHLVPQENGQFTDTKFDPALKGLNIIKQDNVLFYNTIP